jgi:hypothetical protein
MSLLLHVPSPLVIYLTHIIWQKVQIISSSLRCLLHVSVSFLWYKSSQHCSQTPLICVFYLTRDI